LTQVVNYFDIEKLRQVINNAKLQAFQLGVEKLQRNNLYLIHLWWCKIKQKLTKRNQHCIYY